MDLQDKTSKYVLGRPVVVAGTLVMSANPSVVSWPVDPSCSGASSINMVGAYT